MGKVARKGTGFVHLGEIPPPSDEEDDDGEEDAGPKGGKTAKINDTQKKTGFDQHNHDPNQHAKIQDTHGDNESKIVRKGTGFVHAGELPPTESEDEEEEEKENKPQQPKKAGFADE